MLATIKPTSFDLHGDAERRCASMALKEAIGASVRAHGAQMPMFEHQ